MYYIVCTAVASWYSSYKSKSVTLKKKKNVLLYWRVINIYLYFLIFINENISLIKPVPVWYTDQHQHKYMGYDWLVLIILYPRLKYQLFDQFLTLPPS